MWLRLAFLTALVFGEEHKYSPKTVLLKFDDDCLRKSGPSVDISSDIFIEGDPPASAPIRQLFAGIQRKSDRRFSFHYLSNLKVFLIGNPHLSLDEVMPLFDGLPCLDHPPRPDRIWSPPYYQPQQEPLGIPRRELESITNNHVLLDPVVMAGVTNRQLRSRYLFSVPADPLLRTQWHLFGRAQGSPYGIAAIDAWTAAVIQQRTSMDSSSRDPVIRFKDVLDLNISTTVAIVDAGCSRNDDLATRFWRNPLIEGCDKSFSQPNSNFSMGDCVGFDFGMNKSDPTIGGNSHGTETSGLLAAETNNHFGIAAVCPTCRVMCLKVWDDQAHALSTSAIIKALDYLIGHKEVRISNHSYGGFGVDAVERYAMETLSQSGHLAFVAAGNNGCDLDCQESCTNGTQCPSKYPMTPATYPFPGIISVGSSNSVGERSTFSNWGIESVDFFAPGTNITTIESRNSPSGRVVSGTSFSAPIAAGAAAFLLGLHPNLTAEELKQVLMSSGTTSPPLKTLAQSGTIVNMANALVALSKRR